MSGMPQGIEAALWLVSQGLTLIPLQPKSKLPARRAWSTDARGWLTTPAMLHNHYVAHPDRGYSLLHGPSGTVALDIDQAEYATVALSSVGLDLPKLLNQPGLKIVTSKGLKPVYRLPDGLGLSRVCLTWPSQSPQAKETVVLELRTGRHHDAVPPTVHPSTGRPYTLAGDLSIPEIPPELLALWVHWGDYKRIMQDACPWRLRSASCLPITRKFEMHGAVGCSVIDQYNQQNPIGEVLVRHGYLPTGLGRWLYSGSLSGEAGVVLLKRPGLRGQPVIWSHHAGDPLAGYPWDAVGIELLLSHGINTYTASPTEIRRGLSLLGGIYNMDQTQQDHQWSAMLSLPPAQPPLATLTPDYLPPTLSDWLLAEAKGAGVPLEMLAIPVIYCAGAIMGTRLALRNSVNAPAVPANLWALICSPPGTRKTYALDLGVMALRRLQEAADQRAAADRHHREAARDIAKAHWTSLNEAQIGRAHV